MKMDISKLLNKILSEQSTTSQSARGIDWGNTGDVLKNVINNCDPTKKTLPIKVMSKSAPLTSDGKTPWINNFPEINNLNLPSVAYLKDKIENGTLVVFGVIDPEVGSKANALYAYTITSEGVVLRRPNGMYSNCPYLQKFEDVGKVNLSAYDKSIVDSMFGKFGVLYDTPDKTQMGNYEKVFLKDIPGLTNPGNGFIWVQRSAAQQKLRNANEDVNNDLIKQGFTATQPDGVARKFGFTLKMVRDSVISKGGRDTDYYWVDVDSPNAPSLDPSKETCKAAIEKLHRCMKQTGRSGGQTSTDCDVDVVKNKFTALRCQATGRFGAQIGLRNEFDDLIKDPTTKFGLRRFQLKDIEPQQIPGVTNESTLELKINKLLNEEHSKFSFNPTNEPKYQFDKVIIEELANQLVVSALFDVQKSLSKTKRLNENMFGDIAGSLSSNWMDKLVGGGKEYLASKVISMLGFDPTSYTALVFKNIFANLDFNQYDDFLSNCPKFTNVIVKSALEAWLDLAASKVMGKDKISSVVYMALKNMVTETAANTSTYKRLEKVAGNLVCPLVSGISDSIKSGDINPFN
jgi:hypothetical protein